MQSTADRVSRRGPPERSVRAAGGRLFAGRSAHTIRGRFAFRRTAVLIISTDDITSGYIVVRLR